MKICPNCHYENEETALFCEHCGSKLSVERTELGSRSQMNHSKTQARENFVINKQPKAPKPKWPIIIAALAVVAVVGGVAFAVVGNNQPDSVIKTTTTTSSDDPTKYDDVIAEAKALTINGDFKESNRKLATISASDLGKTIYSPIKDEVDRLTKENDEGIEEEKEDEREEKETDNNQGDSRSESLPSGSAFTGSYGKWANTYSFYYNQSSQKHQTLKISANGAVTQTNAGGSQYFGTATITGASGDILSYETNEQYPSSMPETKTIHPDVKITVTWEGGSKQVYYGYLSYSSRLALTDGSHKGSGVNEVWLTY
ncbi:zinc ribbon domain-containing protein [Enterococcus alishanensis]|uniref:Zinc ribbon domain-containing protein n=1 Tax=Enterococcus alishanensis TaxID=1303817 RepID=A0ABS6TFJ5_9ENTE|nr:zinc ribbon domain-containing protein [Enterococcus alishanensis]MBV7391698.1 zinc ribbon domain-containing protein [Enterococcus alishanensis]